MPYYRRRSFRRRPFRRSRRRSFRRVSRFRPTGFKRDFLSIRLVAERDLIVTANADSLYTPVFNMAALTSNFIYRTGVNSVNPESRAMLGIFSRGEYFPPGLPYERRPDGLVLSFTTPSIQMFGRIFMDGESIELSQMPVNSPAYGSLGNYLNLYDQVKLASVTFEIKILETPGFNTGSQSKYIIHTSIDRNHNITPTFRFENTGPVDSSLFRYLNAIAEGDFDTTHVAVRNSASSMSTLSNTYGRSYVRRTVAASSLLEKAGWIDPVQLSPTASWLEASYTQQPQIHKVQDFGFNPGLSFYISRPAGSPPVNQTYSISVKMSTIFHFRNQVAIRPVNVYLADNSQRLGEGPLLGLPAQARSNIKREIDPEIRTAVLALNAASRDIPIVKYGEEELDEMAEEAQRRPQSI